MTLKTVVKFPSITSKQKLYATIRILVTTKKITKIAITNLTSVADSSAGIIITPTRIKRKCESVTIRR